jgi:hypothetical protein
MPIVEELRKRFNRPGITRSDCREIRSLAERPHHRMNASKHCSVTLPASLIPAAEGKE